MAITLFGTAVNPTDGGTYATDAAPISLTPPGSMTAGMLVIVTIGVRNNSNTIAVSETGGQTWNYSGKIPLTAVGSATCALFWCRFNGTWSANPTFSTTNSSSTTAISAAMAVFSPDVSGSTWDVDTAIVLDSDTALTSSPYTATLGSITTTDNGALAVAVNCWTDDVNDTVYTANGWSTALVGQDNATGTGIALTILYKIMSTAGATGDYALAASTGGYNDAVVACIESYLPTAPAATKILKLLAHSSAASATGVNGIVFNSSAGIAGTEIGEFTNKSFEATLESGKAVLKVPVADFGGGALTTSDTPVALVRNSTKTTGIISCTVIEE